MNDAVQRLIDEAEIRNLLARSARRSDEGRRFASRTIAQPE